MSKPHTQATKVAVYDKLARAWAPFYEDPQITAILLYLVDRTVGWGNEEVRVSLGAIARNTGVKRTTLKIRVSRLVDDRLVTRHRRGLRDKFTYTINLEWTPDMPIPKPKRGVKGSPADPSKGSGDDRSGGRETTAYREDIYKGSIKDIKKGKIPLPKKGGPERKQVSLRSLRENTASKEVLRKSRLNANKETRVLTKNDLATHLRDSLIEGGVELVPTLTEVQKAILWQTQAKFNDMTQESTFGEFLHTCATRWSDIIGSPAVFGWMDVRPRQPEFKYLVGAKFFPMLVRAWMEDKKMFTSPAPVRNRPHQQPKLTMGDRMRELDNDRSFDGNHTFGKR